MYAFHKDAKGNIDINSRQLILSCSKNKDSMTLQLLSLSCDLFSMRIYILMSHSEVTTYVVGGAIHTHMHTKLTVPDNGRLSLVVHLVFTIEFYLL